VRRNLRCAQSGFGVALRVPCVVTQCVTVQPVGDEDRDAGDESADRDGQNSVDDDPTSGH
jgi:hypothetical protein